MRISIPGKFMCSVLLLAVALSSGRVHAEPSTVEDSAASVQTGPFLVRAIELPANEDRGPVRGWLAEIDLGDPDLEVVVTAPRDDAEPEMAEAVMVSVPDWANAHGLQLAINANFFGGDNLPPGETDILGLSISDGQTVSPGRSYGGKMDPVLLFDDRGHAAATASPEPGWFEPNSTMPPWDIGLNRIHDAVASIGGSATAPQLGGLLVHDGQNLGKTARVDPDHRHPRTAAGVNADGTRLYLVVIDGRQPERSVGMTLPELADLMIEVGADDAVALDGGGSSSFYFDPANPNLDEKTPDSAPIILNQPSDGEFRPVANHLGFRWHPAADRADRER